VALYEFPAPSVEKFGCTAATGNPDSFHSNVDREAMGLIFTPPIMGQQLRARAKRKRRIRQIRNKEDAVKAASSKTKAKK